VLVITNGAVPSANVDVIWPVADSVVNAPVPGVPAPMLDELMVLLVKVWLAVKNATTVLSTVVVTAAEPLYDVPVKPLPNVNVLCTGGTIETVEPSW
jgi:hypothetical protein